MAEPSAIEMYAQSPKLAQDIMRNLQRSNRDLASKLRMRID
jgi:hypothetical protein